jgi:hypothetical protein
MKKLVIALLCLAGPAATETVDVKFRGPVGLKRSHILKLPRAVLSAVSATMRNKRTCSSSSMRSGIATAKLVRRL